MINQPTTVIQPSFQLAWREAAETLSRSHWHLHNLVVQISDATSFDASFHEALCAFCNQHALLGPKQVAYTIFPHQLYAVKGSADGLFTAYNRRGGLFDRLHRRFPRSWGTYFRRMTCYESAHGVVNQLDNIIQAINKRGRLSKAAYTIVIEEPGRETIRPRGSPCLNYIAVQIEPAASGPVLGLLCVYRHHDFLQRAYGNYWGLCNLACFLSRETHSRPGPITCVSSRAYVERLQGPIGDLLGVL